VFAQIDVLSPLLPRYLVSKGYMRVERSLDIILRCVEMGAYIHLARGSVGCAWHEGWVEHRPQPALPWNRACQRCMDETKTAMFLVHNELVTK